MLLFKICVTLCHIICICDAGIFGHVCRVLHFLPPHALGASFDKSINNEECVFDDEDDGHSSSSARNYRGIAPSWHSLCHSILTVCKERLRFAGGGFLFMSTIY